MKREEAVSERDRLSRGDPTQLWATKERAPGDWIVVRARVAGLSPRPGKLTPEVQSPAGAPRPEDDVAMPPHWLVP
jgi:hypothetical protein